MHTSLFDAGTLAVEPLRGRFAGRVIGPQDPEYDEARALFYSGFDRRPAVVIRAANANDVSRVIALASETGLELAVRGGGHSPAGHGANDGGITLDLSAMRTLDIDTTRRVARADAGLSAGEYTAAVGAHGLATGFGDAPSVGIGGITLAGGVGFLHRKHGLTIDNLLGAEVVTADGRQLYTDSETEPELFWAIRGGGGNFGVVTRLHFRLHDVHAVLGGMLIFPATPELIAAVINTAEESPEELSGILNVMAAPPLPFIPAEHHGRLIVAAMLVYAGPIEPGQRALAPFRALATPIADLMRPIRYPQIYDGHEAAPHPVAFAVRTMFLDHVDRVLGEVVIEHLQASQAPMRVAQFRVLGGAVARVPADATAFAHRTRRLMATVAAAYEHAEEAPKHDAWAGNFAAALRQGEPGAYVGFLSDEGAERVQEVYPGATWDRLTQIKARYDPDNLFCRNQNVPPGASHDVLKELSR